MKLPNFRLFETQATASMVLGLLAAVLVGMLAFFVFRGFDSEYRAVTYDPTGQFGRFRRPLVYGATGLAVAVGAVAGVVGFRSLGQRRNTKQGRSWLGMTLGALAMAAAPVLFTAWRLFSQTYIQEVAP